MSLTVALPIITAIVGAIVGALAYHFLEVRREKKKAKPFKTQREDTIRFLKMMRESGDGTKSREQDFLKSFKAEIGEYRLNRVLPALAKMDIVAANPSVRRTDYKIKGKFDSYTHNDIDHLIKHVKQGVYDHCFQVD